MVDLLSVSQALQRILDHISPLESAPVSLESAAGFVLAREILSGFDIPLFPCSSMDGFAVQAGDVAAASIEAPVHLAVVADVAAGTAPEIAILPGQAARIMTGAMVPSGADAIVPVEDTDHYAHRHDGGLPKFVKITRSVHTGDNIRLIGQDVRCGEVVLSPGKMLRSQELGFLAMMGVSDVLVHRMPRVALFSSGDELLPVSALLTPGKIHDANSYTLIAQLRDAGAIPVSLGIVPDKEEAVRACLERAVAMQPDMILSTAGVSVGAFDFVRSVIEKDGDLNFWLVNMRPGKPLAFGHYRGIPFFGLPGNPVSAFMDFEVFVRPAIARMRGLTDFSRQVQKVMVVEPIESDGRESYLRAVVSRQDGRWVARLTGHQGSGNLRSLVQSNAFLIIPSEVKSLPSGSQVDAWIFDGF